MKTGICILFALVVTLAGCRPTRDPDPIGQFLRPDRRTGLLRTPASRLVNVKQASRPAATTTPPAAMSLTTMPPIEPNGQGNESSCVAWATAYSARSYLLNTGHTTANGSVNYATVFSPEYLYNQIKQGSDCQGGSYFVSPNPQEPGALEVLVDQGVCLWQTMPYTDAGCSTQPTSSQRTAAAGYKISRYEQVVGFQTDDLKRLLTAQTPIVVGVTVDEGFVNADADFVWKSPKGQSLGSHALVIIGYDNARQAFKLMNSWGTAWGAGGYSWLDYSYYNQVVFEAYILYK